jgi:hypothetical protein
MPDEEPPLSSVGGVSNQTEVTQEANGGGLPNETKDNASAGSGDGLENSSSMLQLDEALNMLNLNQHSQRENVALNLKLEEIDSSDTRQCPPVVLIAGYRSEIRPYSNKYELKGEFLSPAKINKWAIVILFDDQIVSSVYKGFRLYDEVEAFANRYVKVARSRGIAMKRLDTIQFVPEAPSNKNTVVTMTKEQLKLELRKLVTKLNDNLVDHAILVLPENCPVWVHNYVQYIEMTEWGSIKKPGVNLLTRTSRIRFETLMKLGIRSRDRGEAELIPQLLLKYNMKLGGINVALKRTFDTHELRFLDDGFLLLAIDLCKLNSIAELNVTAFEKIDMAAVVGMWDLASVSMSFRTATRAQRSDKAVTELDALARDVVLNYKSRKGGKLPKHIIIFRNVTYQDKAVELAQQELTSIRTMLASECEKTKSAMPLLTYLRVPKKKKFSKFAQICEKKFQNVVRTGSLVDSIIPDGGPRPTSSAQSSTGPAATGGDENLADSSSGTTQPFENYWRVFKVFDENDLSPASIRAMMNSLSFMSPRTTKRTRPAPIDLADTANEKSRLISAGWFEDNGNKYWPADTDRMLADLNQFLTRDFGDEEYKNRLYYA